MIAVALLTATVAVAVIAEVLLPGRGLYYSGWYNVGVAAAATLLVISARRRGRVAGRRIATAALSFGGVLLACAGVANGLFAPGPQLVVGAPGQTVPISDPRGFIAFPAALVEAAPQLETSGRSIPISRERYTASFAVQPVQRTVVAVDAFDQSGAHLTITQPAGATFLSPVLLMRHVQRISGLDLPFDSFAVPAAHRIVKVVLFDAQQISALRGVAGSAKPAVLLAVDDDSDTPIAHALRFVRSGESATVAGIRVRVDVRPYPAIEIVSIPSLPVVLIGYACIAAGAGLGVRSRLRS